MTEESNQSSSSQWSGEFGNFYSGYTQNFKNEGSSTAAPLTASSSNSNGDAMNALISIVGGGISKTLSDLQTTISDVKTNSENSSKEIKDKIDNLNKLSWVEQLLNPTTLAVLGIVLILLTCFIGGILKKYTGVSLADLKDYILSLSGGLVGLLGGGVIKNSSK